PLTSCCSCAELCKLYSCISGNSGISCHTFSLRVSVIPLNICFYLLFLHLLTVWIGLYREKLWSDGSDSLFRYWADVEPNDPSGDQCVAGSFNDSGRWSDENCSLSYPFICYKPSNVSHFGNTLFEGGE
uniref:C-type lectin domain-containing protein n=1 Tax=Poecilia reticulata TaxID=8081 RepID=A0A3P9PHC9_POERE